MVAVLFSLILPVLMKAPGAFDPTSQEELEFQKLLAQLGADSPADRDAASQKLKSKGRASVAYLRPALSSKDKDIAARASELIRWIEIDSGLGPELKKALPRIVDRLAAGSPSDWVLAISEALTLLADGKISETACQPDLRFLFPEAILGAKESRDKLLLCDAAARARITGALPQLLAWCKADEPLLRGKAAETLARLGLKESRSHLEKLLGDASPFVRARAIEGLGTLQSQESSRLIASALEDDEPNVRLAALRALASLKTKEFIPRLIRHFSDPDPIIRLELHTNLLEDSVGADLPDLLLPLVKAPDSRTRAGAVTALSIIKCRKAVPWISPLLEDSDADVRRASVAALGALRAREYEKQITVALSDGNPGVRAAAVRALARLSARGARHQIARLMKDESSSVREGAASTLGELDARDEMPSLLAGLSDEVPSIRRVTLASLACFGSQEPVAAIRDLLRNDSVDIVKADAARALGIIGGKLAEEALEAALEDVSSEVRLEAATSLALLGNHKGVRILLKDGGKTSSLFCLNALRKPSVWRTFRSHCLQDDIAGNRGVILRNLAELISIRMEMDPQVAARLAGEPVRTLSHLRNEKALSVTEALGQLRGGDLELILDEEYIKVVSREDALSLWSDWWNTLPK